MRIVIRISLVCFTLTSLLTGIIYGQIIIDHTDMPIPGDTLRVSQAIIVPPGFETGGDDQVWDFSSLQPAVQRIESFISATATPSAYQFFFVILGGANMAAPLNIPAITGFPVSEGYTFFRKSTGAYQNLGMAFSIQGFPVPARYDIPDDLYKFPLQPGNSWNSRSAVELPVPDLVYLSVERERSTLADGWGTLITPFGTFQTIRLKSEVTEEDSIYLDSISNGFSITRNYTEYKWLAKEESIPVLTVTREGAMVSAVYRDIPRQIVPGIPPVVSTGIGIAPNPVKETVLLTFPPDLHFDRLVIRSVDGRLLETIPIPQDKSGIELHIDGWKPGLYLVTAASRSFCSTTRLLVLPD